MSVDRTLTGILLTLLLVCSLPAQAFADPLLNADEAAPAPTSAEGPSDESATDQSAEEPGLLFRGFAQTSYSLNSNDPSDGLNRFRVYDYDDRQLKLDLVNLDLQYAQEHPGHVGFRFDLTGGQTHPQTDAARGLFRDFDTGDSDTAFDFRQAYLSYNFEDPHGTRLDLGKFATHIGYEVMDGVDGVNANGSRSFAFAFGPFTHTGARLSVPVSDEVTVTGLAVLGWDNFRDNNDSISLGFQVAAQPTDDFGLALNYIDGPETDGNGTNRRRLWDFVANWQLHPQVNLGVDLLTGTDQGVALNGSTGTWKGAVLYLQPQLTDWLNLNLRYEVFDDEDGARTGVAQTLRAFTLSPTFKLHEDWVVQLDLRWDESTQPVFDQRGNPSNTQMTTFLRAIYLFGD